MTAAWFVAELAVRATLLIGASWAAAAMLRKAGASAAARHMAWLLGIAALLALPIAWWLAPPLPLPILETAAVSVATAGAPPAATSGAAHVAGWSNMLLAVWLIGVAAMLLRDAMSRRLVWRLWRDAEPARGAGWQELLTGVSRELGLYRPVALRIARGPAMPMTWGTLSPRILLPAEAGAWPTDRRRLVLLHELAHVARRDSLSRSAASLACALYWFHPGAWFAARQMRLEQECAADDRVLIAGAAARTYARSLLDLARRIGETAWPAHAAAMAGMCQLERRVVSITGPARRERPGLLFHSASAAIAAFVMLAVAAGMPVSPAPGLPDLLRSEAAAPAPRIAAAPAGGDVIVPEARMGESGAIDPRIEARAREPGGGYEAPPVAAARSQAEDRARTVEAPAAQGPDAAPFQAAATGGAGQDALPSPRQLGLYGPPRPQPIAAEQETDPRIPAALRRGDERRADARSGERGMRPFPLQLTEGGSLHLVLGNGR